ncbi:MAG: 4-hydroxy-tetrahydrodipicolinate reductase [Gammaproteobacteria bacterium]|jgi:4-hydroxy-tetrahydrodipicolinate reductase|nr:4-hydroxy-tetrahydrodipicolinate reductase [Gammaproteobacteria bacterium]
MSGIAVFGITGRMGQTLVRALREGGPAQPLRLVGAGASAHSARLGSDAAAEGTPTGVIVTADLRAALRDAAVAVDFSLPQCVFDHARACVEARVPLLIGTTGFDVAARAALDAAAAVIPVLIAPNTSVGVNLMTRLVKLAARALGPAYDVEISEAHHRAKRDAPSGTALALGEVVAAERGTTLSQVAVFDRQGADGQRSVGDIGFSVLRAGDIVGEHTVTFAIAGERVEITHRATDRITFARGALRAAEWLQRRPPGLYSMDDVLGLDQL